MGILRLPQDDKLIRSIIPKVDYSNALTPDCSPELLAKTCDEALRFGFAAVAVYPMSIEYVAKRLEGSGTNPQIATGFPCGNHLTETKLFEAKLGLDQGAKEVDLVISIQRFLAGDYNYCEDEIRKMVELAAGYSVGVKVIIEVGFLKNDEMKIKAGSLAVAGGAEFIKIGTGWWGRANNHDVALLVENFGNKAKIKASSGILSLEDMATYIEIGASRCAGRIEIVNQLDAMGFVL